MKDFLRNVFATTGITIILLVTIGTLIGGDQLFFSAVFQSLVVNILIHAGLIFINRIESKYSILESALKIGYIFLIIIPAGILCKWFETMPFLAVIIIGLLVYFIGCFINIARINNDIKFINRRLAERKAGTSNEVPPEGGRQ
jgi:hypothetical protein